ncbi:MAG: hypothetical protein AAGL10_09405 [Pseudomonadota bacterium]
MLPSKYPITPQVREAINSIAQEIGSRAADAAYVVYLIYDPSRPDPAETYPSLPLYVGETLNVEARYKDHMQRAMGRGGRMSAIHKEINSIGMRGVLPRMLLLEGCQTRLESVGAENRWAQLLWRRGYKLFNLVTGQCEAVTDQEYRRYQSNRF